MNELFHRAASIADTDTYCYSALWDCYCSGQLTEIGLRQAIADVEWRAERLEVRLREAREVLQLLRKEDK